MTEERDIEAYLTKADPLLGKLIKIMVKRIGKVRITKLTASPFESLVHAVIYQQMRGEAAAAIYGRFQQKMKKKVTPNNVLALSHKDLRAVGISSRKADYIRNVAQWFADNPKVAKALTGMTNEEVIAALTAITGIGVWSANVFLIFTLGRMDVVSIGDLGMRQAAQLVYGRSARVDDDFIREKSRLWKPYQSIASIYLWQSIRQKITVADLRKTPP